MSGAIAVTTAVVAIGVAAEVGTTFAVVAAVGATVAAVGAVTGIKELQYAGMALGAVGGIGALASSAGMFAGEAASFAGEAATDAGSWAGSVSAAAAPEGGYTMANLAESGLPGAATGFDASALPGAAAVAPTEAAPSLDVINQVNGLPPGGNESIAPGSSGAMGDIPDAGAPNPTPAAATDTGPGAVAQGTTEVAPTTGLDPAAAPPSQQPTGLIGGGEPALTSTVTTVPADTAPVTGAPSGAPAGPITGTTTPAPLPDPTAVTGTVANPLDGGVPGSYAAAQKAVGAVGPAPVGGGPSIWSDIMGVIGKPGVSTLISGAVQAGGAFIAGATSTLTPAQIRALNAQAEANTAATNLANQNAALAANQLKNFTGATPKAYLKPDNMGIINQPPPVTGVPA